MLAAIMELLVSQPLNLFFFFFFWKMTIFLALFSAENAPASDRKDLLLELDVLKKLKPHPHVIKLVGCVTESGNKNNFFT